MSETATRAGFAAIIGAPNAGKSTLVNRLVGAKVSIVTQKVQTTRFPVRGVAIEGAAGRAWSKVPLAAGWERVISGNTCPKGLLEDARQMRVVKEQMEEARREHPNLAQTVRDHAFGRPAVAAQPAPARGKPAWLPGFAWFGSR